MDLTNVKLIETGNSNLKKAVSASEESSESEKTADFDEILDENIEEMNLDNMLVTEKDDNNENIFSNMKESAMAVFDEDVLEEELSEASVKPSHTPWTLIGMGVGGGVLVVVLAGVVLAGVMVWRTKKVKKAEI